MPSRETLERAKRDKLRGKSPSTQADEFIREEIHHVREGKHLIPLSSELSDHQANKERFMKTQLTTWAIAAMAGILPRSCGSVHRFPSPALKCRPPPWPGADEPRP